MKILHTVENYHPSVGGMQEVVRRLSEGLAKLGHSVEVATSRRPDRDFHELNGVTVRQFSIEGNMVRGMHGEISAYQDFLLGSQYDIVANFAAQQWATDLMPPLLGRIRARKVFIPTGFSALFYETYQDYFVQVAQWMKQYDMNVFLSEEYRDITFARTHGVDRLVVIPNGASAEEFDADGLPDVRKALGISPDHFLVLHVGSHSGAKGHQEAIEIFSRAKINDATFLLIGNADVHGCAHACRQSAGRFRFHPRRLLDHKRIVVASLGRPETVAAYHAADVFLFPSRIECSPLVLFEAMAGRTPFLTTDVGNAAEIIRWSGGGSLLPTYKDATGYARADVPSGAKMLEQIYREPGLRSDLAQSGYSAWKERFTWEKICRQYECLYRDLLRE